MLTGLSARSYGRFMFYVTRIAAGRVMRGLPASLSRCGFDTFTLYPAYGDFLSARRFQQGVGIRHFVDLKGMGVTSDMQPDKFFFDQALRTIESEHRKAPLFLFAYVAVNHFPWDWTFRPRRSSARPFARADCDAVRLLDGPWRSHRLGWPYSSGGARSHQSARRILRVGWDGFQRSGDTLHPQRTTNRDRHGQDWHR